jgi:putative FmdB family regulatory protein
MPIFEYECAACGHAFEALVLKDPNVTCPKCSSAELNRLHSSFGVSSHSTRQSALSAERKVQARVQRDKAIADQESAHHSHDH